MWMVLTILVSAAGGLLLLRAKVPGGMLVGAVLGVAIFNLITQEAFLYPQARVAAQALTGAYIGCMITREDVARLPRLLPPLSGSHEQFPGAESADGRLYVLGHRL